MNHRSIRYRDTWAAPGSQLHAAIEDGDTKRAEAIYRQCEKDAAELIAKSKPATPCECRACLKGKTVDLGMGFPIPVEMTQMFVCAKCGNKRCPHANDHANRCTNSNEPGQPGSAYQ